ncbi:MAG: addiction module protein [Kiritimatiellales bacterium]
MSIPEKLLAMEQLWDDFCRRAESMQSPEWRRDVLTVREERVKHGTSQFADWNDAKKRIRDRTS